MLLALMGGKPSLLLPGTAGTKSALWQGGKQPLSDAEGGFFDEWRIGAAVSLGVACVDQQKHPSVGKRLRLPVADEPGAADALRDRLDVAVRFLHAARLDGLNCYVHCARGVSRSSGRVARLRAAYLPEALATPAAATTWLEAIGGRRRCRTPASRACSRTGSGAAAATARARGAARARSRRSPRPRRSCATPTPPPWRPRSPPPPARRRARPAPRGRGSGCLWSRLRAASSRARITTVEVVLDSRKGLDDVAAQARRDAEDLWIDRTVRREKSRDAVVYGAGRTNMMSTPPQATWRTIALLLPEGLRRGVAAGDPAPGRRRRRGGRRGFFRGRGRVHLGDARRPRGRDPSCA